MTAAIQGLVTAVIGILLATTYRLGRSNIDEPATLVIASAAFVAGAVFHLHAALIVLVAGFAGIPLFSRTAREPQARSGGAA
jgi:chromate transport protein ChrA